LQNKNISTGSRNSRDGAPSDTFKNSLDISMLKKWGYDRFWLAEHHNMPGMPVVQLLF
jgi:alkanesulfonate monooxygenase SsuD/methylene tetrahydromethanopterin reductase-like flavin-dependent oxidoreductase (luciferase family)